VYRADGGLGIRLLPAAGLPRLCIQVLLGSLVCDQRSAPRRWPRRATSTKGSAFTAGLLHDIGRLVLATYYPRQLEAAIADAQHARRRAASTASVRCSHLTIARSAPGWPPHWHFADVVVDAIGHHHEPPPRDAAAAPTLGDLIHVADGIAHALDLTREPDEMVPPMALGGVDAARPAAGSVPHRFHAHRIGKRGVFRNARRSRRSTDGLL